MNRHVKTQIITLVAIVGLIAGTVLAGVSSGQEKVLLGRSQAKYTSEPYVGQVRLTMSGQKIIDVKFEIIDTLKQERFESDYEKHYPDHPVYQQQCRNDWQGVLNYPRQLLEKQDLSKVDGISGATWSYNLFRAAVKNALDNQTIH